MINEDYKTMPFGSVFTNNMVLSHFDDGQWQPWQLQETGPLPIHPAAHVLHYASCCFEGLKAFRQPDGNVGIFRLEQNIKRMQMSASKLCLPIPDTTQLRTMILALVENAMAEIPAAPSSLYLRPNLIGTEANVGKAGAPSAQAILYVLASPVGDYFSASTAGVRVALDDEIPRSTPEFGMAKAGANYAQALRTVERYREQFQTQQVLFAHDNAVQETGASNYILLDGKRLVTQALNDRFLHGVTRDSILQLARDDGYRIEEVDLAVDDFLALIDSAEVGLTGTAATLTPIAELVYQNNIRQVAGGRSPDGLLRLKEQLQDIQFGRAQDRHGWLTYISQA